MRYATGPILVIVAVVLLLWAVSAATSGDKPADEGNDNCPYLGPGGC